MVNEDIFELKIDLDIEAKKKIPISFWKKQQKRLYNHDIYFKKLNNSLKVNNKEMQRPFDI
jgi:hypothetical protein